MWQYKRPSSTVEYRARTRRSLFLSCHEICHEATCLYFAHNTFILLKIPLSDWEVSSIQRKTVFVSGVVQWLKMLGSQVSLVEYFISDRYQIKCRVSWDCLEYYLKREGVDAVPLLKFFWKSGARPSVTFEHCHNGNRAVTARFMSNVSANC